MVFACFGLVIVCFFVGAFIDFFVIGFLFWILVSCFLVICWFCIGVSWGCIATAFNTGFVSIVCDCVFCVISCFGACGTGWLIVCGGSINTAALVIDGFGFVDINFLSRYLN